MNLVSLLRGKKTIFCAVVALLYIIGSALYGYECDGRVLTALGFGAAIFLRTAIASIIPPEIEEQQRVREAADREASMRYASLLRTLICAAVVVLCAGCASFSTTQEDLSYDEFTGAATRKIVTRAASRTFFDAKSQLARFKATQTDKSQSAQVGELGQETSGTNAVQVLDRLYKIVSALPK